MGRHAWTWTRRRRYGGSAAAAAPIVCTERTEAVSCIESIDAATKILRTIGMNQRFRNVGVATTAVSEGGDGEVGWAGLGKRGISSLWGRPSSHGPSCIVLADAQVSSIDDMTRGTVKPLYKNTLHTLQKPSYSHVIQGSQKSFTSKFT